MKCWLPVILCTLAATRVQAADTASPALVPPPERMDLQEGTFRLQPATRVLTDASSRATADYLAERLRTATGYKVAVVESADGKASRGAIVLTTRGAKTRLGSEGYELTVSPEGVVIRAAGQGGVFYGVQSLLELLPPQVFAPSVVGEVAWTAPCLRIEDQPRFEWRGLMLDVSRHFFNKQEVKRLLDTMALHKLNVFHWHLVDDHGWRVEIRKYPKLTEVGAWRSDIGFGLDAKESNAYGVDGRYGGYYTQEEIREVIAYAADRHITVVPEIEMPGHSTAALAAYPDLSCSGEPRSTDVPVGVHAGVYCAGREASFEFLEDVLGEVIGLFPGRNIHIGGDEVPKGNWKQCARCQERMKAEGLKNEHELQSYFIRRIEKFINAQGRTLVGWSEIRQGGLARNAVVMDWIGGGREAANEGHDVIMSPTSHCYFDYYQSQATALEPRAIGGYLPLQKVYSFEPVPSELSPEKTAHVLGCQGNLWTEYIPSLKQVEYMAFPRACALAEVAWSPRDTRDWEDFQRRLKTHERRLDALGVNYRRSNSIRLGEWTPSQITTQGVTLEWDATALLAVAGRLSVALSYTKGAHGIRIESVRLLEDGREVAADIHDGFAGGRPRKPVYVLDVPLCKPGARYTVEARVAGDGGTDSRGVLMLESAPILTSATGGAGKTTTNSCAQPSPEEMARSAGVTLPRYPWHVANIWWDFETPTDNFISLEMDVTIDRDVPTDFNLYIAPCGIAKINDLDFYGGLQSNINGWANATNRTRVHPGKGVIFSRWSRDKKVPVGLENVRVAGPDCLIESAGYEGEFASVRRPLAWTKGTYTYRIEKGETEIANGKTNTWFLCRVKDSTGKVHDVGSLRFEGADFTFWARHSAFVEVYSTSRIPRSDIPRVNVTFSWPRINGQKPELKRAHAYYPSLTGPAAPDCAWIRADAEQVRVEVGPIFLRDEKMRRHELPIQQVTVSGESGDAIPDTL